MKRYQRLSVQVEWLTEQREAAVAAAEMFHLDNPEAQVWAAEPTLAYLLLPACKVPPWEWTVSIGHNPGAGPEFLIGVEHGDRLASFRLTIPALKGWDSKCETCCKDGIFFCVWLCADETDFFRHAGDPGNE